VFDRTAYDACRQWTEPDRAAFGYEPVEYSGGEPDEGWLSLVDANIPAIRTLIEQNERFLDLWQLMEASESANSHGRTVVRSLRSVPARAISAQRKGRHRSRNAIVGALVALFMLFVVLPEALGDRPYDPHPSAVVKDLKHP